MSLSERLKLAMDEAGVNQAELARACKVKPPSVNGWLSGKSKFLRGENLLSAARVLRVSQDWLATGKGAMRSSAVDGNHLPIQSERDDVDPGTLSVPVFEAEASMGLGKSLPENDTVVGTINLNEAWVRQMLPAISSPKNLAVLSAYGDSMSPTFNDGDLLLIDRGVSDVKLDAVYVMAFNQQLFVKRIQRRMNGDVVIKSDNPLYDPHVVENGERETLHVLGRVVWAWNGRKL